MARYIIGDIFLGDFKVTQKYGENVDYYRQISSGFLQNGHEGTDWGTPLGTPVLAPFDGKIVRDGFDGKAYGNYLVVWDNVQKCAVWFAHLRDMTVQQNQAVKKGDLIGHTNNTGNTTGPHLHVNFVETDESGLRLNTGNGSQGFLNILDSNLVEWRVAGAMQSVPVQEPQSVSTTQPYLILPVGENPELWLPIKKTDFEGMRAKCDAYDPMIVAGYRKLEDIDTKINLINQQKQEIANIHMEEVKTKDNEIDQLKKTIVDLNDQLKGVLSSYQKNCEQDAGLLENQIKEGHEKQRLSEDLQIVAAYLKTKPTKDSIMLSISELFKAIDNYKKQRPNIFISATGKIKEKAQSSTSIWERLFHIRVSKKEEVKT